LPLFFIRPYRCQNCQRRHYGFGFRKTRREVSMALLAVVMLAAIVSLLVGTAYLLMFLIGWRL